MDYKSYLLAAIEDHRIFSGRREVSLTDEMPIGYGIDDNYVRCMGASITSLCINNPEANFVFHILANGLKDENQEKIKEMAERFHSNIHVYYINNEVFKNLPSQMHLPLPTYYRFILPALLDVPRIIYLDADIICLGNIQDVFKMNMDNKVIMAVPDLELLANKRICELGLKNHTYFNAGMLIIDISKWNEQRVVDRVLTVLQQEPQKFRYLDQDALNLVLTGMVKYLGKEWNRINTPDMVDDGILFLHFAAHPKPWNIAWNKSNLCNDFTKKIYSTYENLSPWANSSPAMPQNYKEMKNYAKCLLLAGDYPKGLQWYGRYLKTKLKIKVCR
nr:glycosyltransferase [Sporomusa sp. GT1]